jgi:hypothetical protein
MESIPFHKGVDPRNILLDMAKNNHIHTDDNYVEYFTMHRNTDGQRRSVKNAQKMKRRNSLILIPATKISGMRTADILGGGYCRSTTVIRCYPHEGRTAKDAYSIKISRTTGWSIRYQIGKFNRINSAA